MNSVDYLEWVKKFDTRSGSDDCYTPPEVYDAAVRFFEEITGIDTRDYNIVRPFYPGGDFEAFEYGPRDIVIDNPPFSIIAKIVKFYNSQNIKYFLFAPGLTLFGNLAPGYGIIRKAVRYDNGAEIATGFISNCFYGIVGKDRLVGRPVKKKTKTIMPEGYESAATLKKYIHDNGLTFWSYEPGSRIRKNDDGKQIFGCAYKVKETDHVKRV